MLEAAPPAAEAPADAAPAVSAERSGFRLPVPKAVLVTVLGFALSAWLVPAMTRQWDDRQKVHELNAEVVAERASVSARALLAGEAVWSGQQLTSRERKRVENEWGLSTLEDQQVAGLIMKIGAGLLLWALIAVFFVRWAADEERRQRPQMRRELDQELARMGLSG